ncbi:hypothetical protein E2562_006824 [Oryza meyeriana var. granulata]|uniref:Uncharacterized protein n=1 Tax=Oryza meyeriana var. granulata TaxID=110450 RepID=A0A6G1C570_9ORYZ|nr:hypothetical protein E2562_006824 [Oryza meyeriana var. granulata]
MSLLSGQAASQELSGHSMDKAGSGAWRSPGHAWRRWSVGQGVGGAAPASSPDRRAWCWWAGRNDARMGEAQWGMETQCESCNGSWRRQTGPRRGRTWVSEDGGREDG